MLVAQVNHEPTARLFIAVLEGHGVAERVPQVVQHVLLFELAGGGALRQYIHINAEPHELGRRLNLAPFDLKDFIEFPALHAVAEAHPGELLLELLCQFKCLLLKRVFAKHRIPSRDNSCGDPHRPC